MMYLLSDVINSVGLALDIGGVILLFLFALPSRVSEEPPSELISFGSDPDSTKQWEKQRKRYKFWSWLALGLLILGFFLQPLPLAGGKRLLPAEARNPNTNAPKHRPEQQTLRLRAL